MEEPAMLTVPTGRSHNRARWVRLPPPTVRLRLTALYGTLFLCCGAGLLAFTYLLVDHATSSSFSYTFRGLNGTETIACGTATRPGFDGPVAGLSPGARAGGWLVRQCQALAVQEHVSVMHHLLAYSGLALAVMALAAAVLGWLVAGRVLRPLRSITTATQAITAHNLHQRLALSGPDDELKALADTIDELLGRLEREFEAQKRFIANVSHELRTPLTMMRTALDVTTGKPGGPAPQVSLLAAKIRKGLDKADRLVDSFLVLARAQRGAEPPGVTVSLGEAAAAALAERGQAIADMRLTVDQDLADAPVQGTALLLARLADNLVDNAIRHNQPGGWISVTTSAEGTRARLAVENGGPVLDERDVGELAQPFRRLGGDRTSTGNGTGLGLSIVAAIAAAHNGTLQLHARDSGGLCAAVTLPAAGVLALAGAAG
jgi:signal transduction histidine kinase